MRAPAILLLAFLATPLLGAEDAHDFVQAVFPVALPAVKHSTVWIENPTFAVAPPKPAAQAPTIDGKLDVLQVAQGESEIGAPGAAVAFVSFSPESISVAVVCALPEAKLKQLGVEKTLAELSKHREHDHDVWMDESVELFIDAGRTKEHYFQFIVNTLNDQQDSEGWTTAWNGDWKSATHVAVSSDDPALPKALKARPECWSLIGDEIFWICEMSIPYATLGCKPPVAGDKWGLQIAHNDKLSNSCLTLSKAQRSNHEPYNFAELKFDEAAPGLCLLPCMGYIRGAGGSWAVYRTNLQPAALMLCKIDATIVNDDATETSARFQVGDQNGYIQVALPAETPRTYRLRVGLHDPDNPQKAASSMLLCHVSANPKAVQISLDQKQYYASEKIARATVAIRGKFARLAHLSFILKRGDGSAARSGSAKAPEAGNECELDIQNLPLGLYTLQCECSYNSFGSAAPTRKIGESSASFEIIPGPFDAPAEAAKP
jgi:hypothetical protein